MKRRNFLQGVVAGAGVAVVPIPITIKPAAAVAANSYKLAGFHYGWACVYAQMNNGIAPADIAEKFRISTAQADTLFKRMLDRGVLHPPGLDGRSHATRPWQPWDQKGPAAARDDARKREQSETETQRDRMRAAFKRMIAPVTKDVSYGWAVA